MLVLSLILTIVSFALVMVLYTALVVIAVPAMLIQKAVEEIINGKKNSRPGNHIENLWDDTGEESQ